MAKEFKLSYVDKSATWWLKLPHMQDLRKGLIIWCIICNLVWFLHKMLFWRLDKRTFESPFFIYLFLALTLSSIYMFDWTKVYTLFVLHAKLVGGLEKARKQCWAEQEHQPHSSPNFSFLLLHHYNIFTP